MDSVRADAWLWAVRIYKTRSAAKTAVVGGHVEVNGLKVKPAHQLKVGDKIEAHVGDRARVVEVVELVAKRVGAPRAAQCMIDSSPAPPKFEAVPLAAVRERGAGRPTKRDRRRLDDLRGGGKR